jgi:hypothetical protein
VDAYDRISEESLGMGDLEFHEIEDQLFDAIDDSGYRAVIKNGDIYMADPNGLPGEIIVVDPAEPEDLDDPSAHPRRRLKVRNPSTIGMDQHPESLRTPN